MSQVIPYIPPEERLPELTIRAVLMGIILAVIMGAANAYLGLYAGMTVSASIPAAVLAIGIYAIISRREGKDSIHNYVLEINVVKSHAAAAEALAAGIIFTFPALVVMYIVSSGEYGWSGMMEHYPTMVIAALLGGLLGGLFMIPLRRVMIVDLKLPYPEGVAIGEVIKVGASGGGGMSLVAAGIGIGSVFKFLNSSYGFNVWKESIEATAGDDNFRIFGGSSLSPALVGVGYILGPRIASIVFAGGVLGWVILIPIMGMINGFPAPGVDGIYAVWRRDTMYVGIGAVITGGAYTLWSIRSSIAQSVRHSISAAKKGEGGEAVARTERDLVVNPLFLLGAFLAILFLFYVNLGNIGLSLIVTLAMMVFAFLFTSVAGYLAGVVGSSNNPISAVTVSTILFTALLLVVLGIPPSIGMMATIVVGAIVCNAASIAGDVMQELKTGQVVGSTPSALEIATFIGIAVSAVIVPYVVAVLYEAYGFAIPTAEHPHPLPAPQGLIMATITDAVFQGSMNWPMFILGVIIAAVLIWRRIPVMAVAIGIYLPLTLTTPIMIGGLVKYGVERLIRAKTSDLPGEERESRRKEMMSSSENNGVLFSAGLIAGEAISGVLIGILVISNVNLNIYGQITEWPGALVFLYLIALLAYVAVREHIDDLSEMKYMFTGRK